MTREKFEAYMQVRESGKTSMLDDRMVSILSGGVLTREDVYDIISNFDTYFDQWRRGKSHGE